MLRPASIAFALSLAALVLPDAAAAQQAQQGAQPAAWTMFRDAEGHFSVLMPAPPKRQEDAITTPPGAPGRTVLQLAMADREIYLAGWAEYSPSFNFGVQAELEANRDNFVKGMQGGALVSSKPVTVLGHPGLEFVAAKPDAWVARGQVFIVGKKPYQLLAITAPGKENAPHVQRFFASFKMDR